MPVSDMRAVVVDSYATGLPRVTVLPRPAPAPGQVLVRVRASGVNPVDYKIRTGRAPFAAPDLPAVLGADLAGIVEATGADVTGFRSGDEVYGLTGGVRGLQGSLADFVSVDAALLAPKPVCLDWREAAAVPLVFLTAWEGLVDKANVRVGQKVLIQGGAGGVGHVAVQIALARGAEVFATVSPGKRRIVESFGATPIDYHSMPVEDYVRVYTGNQGFDVVYDTVGGAVLDDSLKAVRPYGHVVSCAAFGEHSLAPAALRCATLSAVYVLLPMLSGQGRARHGDILREATRLAEKGRLRPVVDPRHFTLDQVLDAHDAVEAGNALIKVVVDVNTG